MLAFSSVLIIWKVFSHRNRADAIELLATASKTTVLYLTSLTYMQVLISVSLDCPKPQRRCFSLLCNIHIPSMGSLAEYIKPFLDVRLEKVITEKAGYKIPYLGILWQLNIIINCVIFKLSASLFIKIDISWLFVLEVFHRPKRKIYFKK